MAAPVPQSFTTLDGADGTSFVINVPSGVVAGNVILVGIFLSTTATITPPSGFTLKTTITCTGAEAHTYRLYWKRATGSDSGTYTFTWTGTAHRSGHAGRFSGVIASGDPFGSPVNTATSNSSGSSTTSPTVTGLTPDRDDCLLVWADVFYFGGNHTPPTGFTERADSTWSSAMATKAQTTAAATGNLTSTCADASQGRSALLAYLLPVQTVFAAASTTAATSAVTAAPTGILRGAAATTAAVSATTGDVTKAPAQASSTTAAVAGGSADATIAHYGVFSTTAATSATSGEVTSILQAESVTAATSGASSEITSILQATSTTAAVSSTSGSILVAGKPGQGSQLEVLFNPDEVLTGSRVTYFQFDLLDRSEHLIGHLYGVDSGEVSFDAYGAVKSTGKLTVHTDPLYRHLPDGQPDFLGVQINTPTGIQAVAVEGTAAPASEFVCADAEAVDISVGDRFIITDADSQPKEQTAFTVQHKDSAAGETTFTFSPATFVPIDAGDLLKVVTVSQEQLADWLDVRIRPMIRIARLGGGDDPEGRLTPAGVYLCAAPVEDWDDRGLKRDVELADKLSILDQDIASGDPDGIAAYALDAGANVIDEVKALIAETGESSPAIEPAGIVLAAPMVWDVGATRLRIINDLLDAAGYFSLFCDGWGQYQAVPYVQPSDRIPVYDSIAPFSDGPESLMDPAWKRDRDIYSIPNRFVAIGQGDGDNAALTSVATNENPDSPYSFQSRGRWITQVEQGVEATSQAALDAIARARLSRATSVTNQLTVRHVFLPDLRMNSVVRFVNPDSGLDTYCYVVQTTIPFDPTALCQTIMRLVT